MPTLPEQWIAAEVSDGTKFEKKVTCGVTTDGVFTIGIPEELVEFVKDGGVEDGRYFNKDGLKYGYHRGAPRLEAKQLESGIKFLRECARKLITVEQVIERVIVYKTNIGVSFWIDGNGKITQNGAHEWNPKGGGGWWKPKTTNSFHASEKDAESFTVGIGAAVLDKITHKRQSGDRIEWKFVRDTKDQDLEALNAFRGASVDPNSEHVSEIPYTPEAAKFFTAALFAICKMAQGLDGFFADKERVQLAIAKGSGLIGFPDAKK